MFANETDGRPEEEWMRIARQKWRRPDVPAAIARAPIRSPRSPPDSDNSWEVEKDLLSLAMREATSLPPHEIEMIGLRAIEVFWGEANGIVNWMAQGVVQASKRRGSDRD